MEPKFIAIEGLDGSGGTTQSRLLTEWLQGQGLNVHLTQEPTKGPVGCFIREALRNGTEAGRLGDDVLPYLFAADRQDHLNHEILPALQTGSWVITDRYYHSSLAYQSLSIGLENVSTLNRRFRRPDLTLILWLDPEISFGRIQQRGAQIERFETLARLRTIAKSYELVYRQSLAEGEQILKVDARLSIEELHQEICMHVTKLMSSERPLLSKEISST